MRRPFHNIAAGVGYGVELDGARKAELTDNQLQSRHRARKYGHRVGIVALTPTDAVFPGRFIPTEAKVSPCARMLPLMNEPLT